MRIASKYNKDKEKENTCLENLSKATKEGDRKSTIKKRSFSHTHNIISPSTPNLSTLFNSYTFTHYFFFKFCYNNFSLIGIFSYPYTLWVLVLLGTTLSLYFSCLAQRLSLVIPHFGTTTLQHTPSLSLSLGISHLWQGYYLTHDPLRQHSLWSWSLS